MEPLTGDDPVEVAGYRLRARLGSGGMGRVYLAFTSAGRAVALKVVRPDLADDPDFRRRFRHEAQAARRVHGLYTAQVLDADPDAVPPWLVTAYVPGPSLHEAVTAHGPMPEQTVFVLLAGVAEALAAIHAAGVVHRDLKPSNVLLAPDGPRVIDFGIARAADATTLTRSGVRVGSPHFMAPEQISGVNAAPAIDVFALGALGAFAALGRSPFGEGDEIAVLYRVVHGEADLSGCPERLREVLQRCLAKDPAERPGPAEVIAACRARLAGQAEEAAASWLPPAVVAALAQHLPPPPLTAASPAATFADPGATVAAPAVAATGIMTGVRGRRGRGPVIAGGGLAAVGLAALLVAGLLTLGNHHGANRAAAPPGSPGNAAAVGTQAPALPPPPPPPPPKPKRKPAVDPCVVGTWTDIADNLVNTINSNPVEFTGHGGYLIVRANGSGFETFGPETMSATVNGNRWTDVFKGSVRMHIDTRGGSVLYSDVVPSKNATFTLYENGAVNNSGPVTLDPGPQRYTCTGTTLRLFDSAGSSVLTRKPPGRR